MTDNAPATDNAPVEPTQTPTEPVQTQTAPEPKTVTAPEPRKFEVPEAYREKGWAKNIKTEEDFWKSLDNAQSMMGKKYAQPDLDKMSDEDREQYFDALRPKDPSEYVFPEGITDAEKDVYSKLLYENGISKQVGERLMKAGLARANEMKGEFFSAEGLLKIANESFNGEGEKKIAELGRLIKSKVSDADYKTFQDELPNQAQGLVLRIVDSLQKAYGATEGAAALNTGPKAVVDVDGQIKSVNEQLVALQKNPFHSQADKQKLIGELTQLYAKKGK